MWGTDWGGEPDATRWRGGASESTRDSVETLHRDDHLLVINKPPGLLSQPDRTGDDDVVTSLKDALAAGAEEPFLGLVHRLDRPASGVMVLARTSQAARDLSKQFRERVVEKRYLVIVEGTLRGIGTWTDYIAKPGREPKIVQADDPEGKRAELRWQALVSAKERTLLQVELHSGRPHQIRLQASTRGHAVVGDGRYGAQSSLRNGTIALHHVLLRLDHPARAHRETYVAGPPPTWPEVMTPQMTDAIERLLGRARPVSDRPP